jgi:hypothetical protein
LTPLAGCAILSPMLIKVRKLGASLGAPNVKEVNGVPTLKAEMLGELVKVPESLREEAELIVGELTMGFFPVGVEVKLDAPHENLNGLWVQREIYNSLVNRTAAA